MSYRILISFLFPAFFIYTLRIAIKFKSLVYFKQRLGFSCPEFFNPPIWIHCASVGEINTFIPLLESLVDALPNQQFLITTTTVTGASMLKKHKPANTQHCFLPLENSFIINRFLQRTQPKLALIMETEIWPLLYQLINKQHIPLSLINARLSTKTINTFGWIKKQYRHALTYVDTIYTRSQQDSELFQQLSNNTDNVQTTGNLKFSQSSQAKPVQLKVFTQREYVLAASTHADEEFQLAELWKKNNLLNTLLVIAPRHPDRLEAIIQQLESLNLKISIRSKGNEINEDTHIYLADTLGELTAFMQKASIVFMGGSLIPQGGHNLLEAARLGKAIIVGPHMHNFQNEVELFKTHRACIQVQNNTELGDVIQSLLTDRKKQNELENSAKQLMDTQTNIADIYLTRLEASYPAIFGQKI